MHSPTVSPAVVFAALPRVSRRLMSFTGGYALVGGLLSLAAWVFDVPRLADWFRLGISIQPNTAVGAIVSGLALLVLRRASPSRAALALCGAVVTGIGALTILEYASGIDVGIDRVLMFGREWGSARTTNPGRMGLPSAVSYVLLGLATLCSSHADTRRFTPRLALIVVTLTAISFTGYLYDASLLYTLPRISAIAFQTATFLFAVGVGFVAATPEQEPGRTLQDEGSAGYLARRALPFIIVLPILVGYLRTAGQHAGYYDNEMGNALLVLALVAMMCGVLWWGITAVIQRERTLALANEALRETTERAIRSEQSLREADRRKDEFLATLAHELRNPLAPIVNSVAIMERARPDEATAGALRSTIARQTRHMVRLIDDLMDVSRITRDRLELQRGTLELGRLVRDAVESQRHAFEAAAQRLTVALPESELHVDGDAVRLTQIVGNLLTNANKYTERGGVVSLAVHRDGEEAVIVVEDSGVGIPPHALDRIFTLFAQVDDSSRRQGGLGIGLNLVQRLVALHGGQVVAFSEGAGRGSRFTVRLPALPMGGERRDGTAPASRRVTVAGWRSPSGRRSGLLV